MGLIYCSDCGKQISEFADKCNNCGFPLNFRQNRNQEKAQINSSIGWILFGYLFPFFAILIHPLFALIGIVFGIINISRKIIAHGIIQIILSIILGFLATVLSLFLFLL